MNLSYLKQRTHMFCSFTIKATFNSSNTLKKTSNASFHQSKTTNAEQSN